MAESRFSDYKCVVFGSGGVGKSSIVLRFVTNTYTDDYIPTIEDCYRKTLEIDGSTVHLDILDTAGQEEFSAARDQWVREGNVFILVYCVNSMDSFKELETFREHILNVKDDGSRIPLILVGNKADIPANQRRVSIQDGKQLAIRYGNIPFVETSALTGSCCDDVFFQAVRVVRQIYGTNTKKQPPKKQAKWWCNIL